MNFKKFISGVSALTIAASAFAGMAVTANAEDPDFNLTSTAVYQVSTGVITANPTQPTVNGTSYRGDSTTAAPIKYLLNSNTEGQLVLYTFNISGVSGTVTSATFKASTTGRGSGGDVSKIRFLGYNGDPTTGTLDNGGQKGTSDGTATNARPFQPLNDTYEMSTAGDINNYSYNSTAYVKSAVDAHKNTVTIAVIENYTRATYWKTTANLEINVSNDEPVGYTVKYVGPDGTTEIKTADTSRTAVAGETVAVTSEDKAAITYGDATYYYDSDDAASLDLTAADPTVTVSFRAATPYIATVNAVADGVGTIGTYTNTCADTTLSQWVWYPVLIKYNSKYYRREANTTNDYWRSSVNSSNTPLSVSYSEVTDKDIVYYAEFEGETTGMSIAGTNPDRYSGGGALAKGTHTTSELPAGNYTVYVALRNGSSSGTTSYTVNGVNVEIAKGITTKTETATPVTLTSSGTITVVGANNNAQMDYVYVVYEGPYVAPPTAEATLVNGNVVDDTDYAGADAGKIFSVYEATVTAGTNAITNVVFTLNNGAMSTDTWSNGIMASGNAVFALIVPMASSAVTDITAVIDNVPYVAFN